MSKVDANGSTVKVQDDGLVKIDGITVFRRVVRDGTIYLQFQDRDRMRASCRGTIFVEVPLSAVCEILSMGADWQTEQPDA
jgi:hypothetical protein